MKSFGTNIFNFYLYSSVHISLCAVAFTCYSMLYANSEVDKYYLLFIASATCLLYSLHRIIGTDKVGEFKTKGRFIIISKHKNHLYIYALAAAIVSGYAYLKLNTFLQLACVVPSIVSLLYVLPVFPGKLRLRDFHFIKLFLIGFCWMWFISTVPAWNYEGVLNLSFSRFLFVMGITIPFDIRDKEVDQSSGVKTLAHIFSEKQALLVASFFIAASLAIIILTPNIVQEFLISEVVVHLLTIGIIVCSYQVKADYYFSFLLDSTMAMFFIIYWVIF